MPHVSELTVGDDFLVPCPHCLKKIRVCDFVAYESLKPGVKGQCSNCTEQFEVHAIEYSPVVWMKKADQ